MTNDEADDILKELFKSLQNRYQNNTAEKIEGSNFVFDYVHLLCYKCHKISPNRGGLFIDSPDWIKRKKVAINSINRRDSKCF